jgi:ComF family protein
MEGGAARLVHALKYEGWFALGGPMGEALAPAALEVCGGSVHRLEPVPLPAARLRERGYNQAELLARSLGRLLGWPVGAALSRDDARRRQVRLGRNERRENVKGAFHARPGSTDGPPVLLVDDVLTTGATAAACALALRGVQERVTGVVAFARALQVMGPS